MGLGLNINIGLGRQGGVPFDGDPSLLVSPTGIALSVAATTPATASTATEVTVTGTNLPSTIAVSALTGFEYSADGVAYTDTLTLPAIGGTLYIRMKGGTSEAMVGGVVTLTSVSTTAEIIADGVIGEMTLLIDASNWFIWDTGNNINYADIA